MDFVKLIYDRGFYEYDSSSNLPMTILGRFLTEDVRCYNDFFKSCVLDPTWESSSGNITLVEKENNLICLSDLYSEEQFPTELQMTIEQFIQLLDDWKTKVCTGRPYLVTIKYENDQFIIETNGQAITHDCNAKA